MTDDTTINFQLDLGKGQSGGSLTYRPWGTRTLKIKVSTRRDMPALRVRPRNMRSEDRKADTFRGFADDSDALMVSWGGGHEGGPCVKPKDSLTSMEDPAPLAAGEQGYVYFSVTHLGSYDPPLSANLTIEAYDSQRRIEAAITIRLTCPDDLPGDVVRINSTSSAYDRWEVSDGGHLPCYDPRWWPEAVAFESVTPPPLVVTRFNKKLHLFWDKQPDPIAIVTDDSKPAIFNPQHFWENTNTVNFELFNFDEWHVALRIWFFWRRKIGLTLVGNLDWHEIPDAERFDFVIRKDSGQVILVCTDLHWSEMWGEVTQMPLKASLGLSRKKIMEEIDSIEKLATWVRLIKSKGTKANTFHNPITFVRRLAEARYRDESARMVRAKGIEAHVPKIHGIIEYRSSRFSHRENQMISSDVRLVFE